MSFEILGWAIHPGHQLTLLCMGGGGGGGGGGEIGPGQLASQPDCVFDCYTNLRNHSVRTPAHSPPRIHAALHKADYSGTEPASHPGYTTGRSIEIKYLHITHAKCQKVALCIQPALCFQPLAAKRNRHNRSNWKCLH